MGDLEKGDPAKLGTPEPGVLVSCSLRRVSSCPGSPIPYPTREGLGLRGESMMDTEAFREFKTGLTLLRDNYAVKALPHMKRAVDLDKK